MRFSVCLEVFLFFYISFLGVRCWKLSSDNTETISQSIKSIRDEVLGVSKFQALIKDVAKLESISFDSQATAVKVARSISAKFKNRATAVLRLQKEVADGFTAQKWSQWQKCCKIPKPGPSDPKIDPQSLCSIESSTATESHKTPNENFLKVAQENKDRYPGLKWQYFGSEHGVFTHYPASYISSCNTTYDNRFRPWYVQASTPKPKDVIIAIDKSGSMLTNNRIGAAVEAATTVINTLNPNDRVTVIPFANEASALGLVDCPKSSQYWNRLTSCYKDMMASATPRNIHHLANEIKKIIPQGETYYTNALALAFDFLEKAYQSDIKDLSNRTSIKQDEIAKSRDRVILFLSDGVPSDSPLHIFKLIKQRNLLLRNSVVILCYELGKGTFGPALKLMARQDFSFHNLTVDTSTCPTCDKPKPGVFHKVIETKNLRSAMGSYYSFFAKHKSSSETSHAAAEVVWSVPYYDVGGLGLVVTAAAPVVVNDKLVGVVGVDLTMHELIADVTYFSVAANMGYAFLLDMFGKVMMHPLLPSPAAVYDDPVITGVEAFERSPDVLNFLNDVIQHECIGSEEYCVYTGIFNMDHILPSGHKEVILHSVMSSLSCSHVSNTKFIICIVMDNDVTTLTDLAPQPVPEDFSLLYHRFDINAPSGLSFRHDQLITANETGVMFAPSAFLDSGGYLEQPETETTLQSFQHFILTGQYFGQPATQLKPSVRPAVLVSWALEKIWLESLQKHSNQHVIWRYFASEHGMFRILPGVQMPKLYNPTHRPWYELAIGLIMDEYRDKNFVFIPGNVLAAISPPYAGASTGDVIITISTAIVEPLPYNSATDQLPHILGVMGADITFSYFESLILAAVPECSDATRYCVVIDTSGYVIFDAALSMKEENAMKLALNSNYHIIHSHPHIAIYLLNENILLRQECADVTTNSFRESYIMNRSRTLHADDLPFSISHLSGTNIIIMSIPIDLQQNDDFPINCVSHLSSNEPCVLPKHGCESPCMEKKRAQLFYDACLNRYRYTWSNAPPPCIPLKYKSNSDKPIQASSDSCDIKPRPADKPSANAADTPIIKEEPFFERNDTLKYIVLFGCVIAFILCLFLAFKQKRRVLVN